MKRILYIVVLAAVLLNPMEGTDVGELIPVEVIAISRTGPWIRVETDTGDRGEGYTLEEAFQNMEDTAPGNIYLDTAEYLLIEEGITVDSLRAYLKDTVRVYRARNGLKLDGVAEYLSAHGPGVKLKQLEKAGRLPQITEENGRYQLK